MSDPLSPKLHSPQDWDAMNAASQKDCRIAALERRVDFLDTQLEKLTMTVRTLARSLGGVVG